MARTKAAKLASKRNRGRPRQEGEREPNGRLSRSGNPSPDKLALETRARRLGISVDKAKDQKAGTFIGYLNMFGSRDGLSDEQYEGAQSYLKLREAHLRALQAPGAIYDPEALGGAGDDPDAYAAWVKRVVSEREEIHRQIQEAQNYSRDNLWAALQLVVIESQHLHHMIGATRILCNVLARHFGSGAQNRRAA
jgi:hypothetical protein